MKLTGFAVNELGENVGSSVFSNGVYGEKEKRLRVSLRDNKSIVFRPEGCTGRTLLVSLPTSVGVSFFLGESLANGKGNRGITTLKRMAACAVDGRITEA